MGPLWFAGMAGFGIGMSWCGFDAASATWAAAFAGDWRVLLYAQLGLMSIALLLAGAERWRSRSRPSAWPELGSAGTRDLEPIRLRLRELAKHGEQVPRLLDELLYGAACTHASDIHITPSSRAVQLTYRIDGALHALIELSPECGRLLTNRIKVLAKLRLEEHRHPQDGRLERQVASVPLELRVATLPTQGGDRVVLRVITSSSTIPDLDALLLPPAVSQALSQLLLKPQGMLFVSGPVGSGKSTTLYGCLGHIHQERGAMTQIVSLEDPIEQRLSFVTQTPIHERGGMSFARALRSALRQDPNVLMVGEIRDGESAEIAARAGLSGHLILTTVHAADAVSVFGRMLEMGVARDVLASVSLGSLAQRLVRSLCPACRRPHAPEAATAARFARAGVYLPPATYYQAVGCPLCEHQGYAGRRPIAELVVVDEPLRQALARGAPRHELAPLAARAGDLSLLSAGVQLATAGLTSLDEVMELSG